MLRTSRHVFISIKFQQDLAFLAEKVAAAVVVLVVAVVVVVVVVVVFVFVDDVDVLNKYNYENHYCFEILPEVFNYNNNYWYVNIVTVLNKRESDMQRIIRKVKGKAK